MINVAIDGPVGAGKSTIAKCAAEKLGYMYVDTGALYRATALSVVRAGIPSDAKDVAKHIKNITIGFDFDTSGQQQVYLNGENVSQYIRTPEISMQASLVSQQPAVREFLLETQREIARKHNVIMDGRDISTVVLPNADVKIYLDAAVECRAERRYKELIQKGEAVTFEDVLADLKKRDHQDMTRELAPLKPAPDSIVIDTTDYDLEESIDLVVTTIKNKIKN